LVPGAVAVGTGVGVTTGGGVGAAAGTTVVVGAGVAAGWGAPDNGAPTGSSQRWPGSPWGGFTATAPVAAPLESEAAAADGKVSGCGWKPWFWLFFSEQLIKNSREAARRIDDDIFMDTGLKMGKPPAFW